ncbi:hypothetical protein EGR_07873 [Echinococcus granulosus]|uniref:Uncharacterized protein n=1 Tax=Echinococcus granulosus TaxID=6210 RepID=W6U7Q8_ECHGR|nr:hypothetical protein EGR_07873 [Echinococcus granulosus]EUB57263.1 hypothetical protein EGR_07873 [Echinococcus granulosus]
MLGNHEEVCNYGVALESAIRSGMSEAQCCRDGKQNHGD